MTSRRHRLRDGAAAVEFAAVFTVLVGLLFGIWEVGRFVEVKQVLINATREGGRRGSLGQSDGDIQAAVSEYLQGNGLNTASLSVTIERQTESTGEQSVTVRAVIPYKDVRWSVVYVFLNSSSQLSATSVFRRQNH